MQLLRSTTLESTRFNPMTGAAARAGEILTIDLAAIAGNYRLLQEQAQTAVCAAVVKADAYGLGAQEVAPVRPELDAGISLSLFSMRGSSCAASSGLA
jgi:alanine racemase